MMPALARRHHSPNLRRNAVSAAATPMVKSDSNSSGDDAMDSAPSKYVNIVAANQLPARYDSDEESTSPCPEDFDDGATFSDIEFDASLDLDLDEVPSINEAKQVSLTQSPSKPILVNISKLAPMEKRVTSSHQRPGLQHSGSLTLKTSIGRTVVLQQAGNASYQPPVVALQRPPIRFRAPPPVPPRSEARTGTPSPSTSTPAQQLPAQANLQVTSYPRGSNHATHPSVSTVGTRDSMYDTDDGSSMAGDSIASSAPSSVADDADLAARSNEAGLAAKSLEFESRKNNNSNNAIHDQQDAELERAINDYMMWRNEGSPGEPPESVYKLTSEDKQIVREVEEEEWCRELEMGLATPTPTTYAAYDPFGMRPPSLVRPRAPFQNEAQQQQPQQKVPARANGIRRGFGMVKRAI